MDRWATRLLVAGPVDLVLGWALVLASGYGGDGSGGSALVWEIGGLMVYAAVPTTVVGMLLGAFAVTRAAARCFGRRRRMTPRC